METRYLEGDSVAAYISCIGKNQPVAETAKVPVTCFPLPLTFTRTDSAPSNSRVLFPTECRTKAFDRSLEQGPLGCHVI